MVKWSDFLPEVLPEAPGVPNAIAVNAVRNAAIELSQHSEILRMDLALINVVKDLQDYPIAAGDDLRTVVPLRVMFDTVKVTPLQEDTKFRRTSSSSQEFSFRYSLQGPELLHLEWIPDTNITNGLYVRLAYKPYPTATECDDILFDDWHEEIACGALSRLLKMPGKPWTSLTEAKAKKIEFKAGMNNAWSRAHKNHTKSTTRVQFNPMSGGSRGGYYHSY